MFRIILLSGLALVSFAQPASATSAYDAMIARHAAANGVPASLVHKVMMRESRGNARAVSKGNYGLMQIRLGTARGLGYTGTAAGLLDPETNMTYAVRYLAGAYRVAGGNAALAQRYYQTGYYYAAKRQRGGATAAIAAPRPAAADMIFTGSITPRASAQGQREAARAQRNAERTERAAAYRAQRDAARAQREAMRAERAATRHTNRAQANANPVSRWLASWSAPAQTSKARRSKKARTAWWM